MSIVRLISRHIADGIHHDLYPGRVTVEKQFITCVERGDFTAENDNDQVIPENFILSPAFIDAHGHSDISLLAMPEAEGKYAQGIAYEISGNCGLSPFPLTEKNREHLQELYRQYQISLDWSDYRSYMHALRQKNPALELFPLTGHNTLRAAVGGYEQKKLTLQQTADMQLLLERELQNGSPGLSLGLLYVPGCFAGYEEITALLKVVSAHDKICTVHLKSEGNDLESALEDTIAAARAAGLKKLHLSHLKTAGKNNFHKLPFLLDALNTSDMRITGDCYCYDASMTQLSVILPAPFDQYDDVQLSRSLHSGECFEQALNLLQKERSEEYFRQVRIISAADEFAECCGQILSDCAAARNLTSAELCLQIIRADAAKASAAYHTLSQNNMQILAAHSSTVPGSDESVRNRTTRFGSSHPRGFGNHPEYFRLRLKQGAAAGKIISEMSAQIAGIFGLNHIGKIAPGYRAVLVKLDPDQYRSTSTFANPHTLAAGAQMIRL